MQRIKAKKARANKGAKWPLVRNDAEIGTVDFVTGRIIANPGKGNRKILREVFNSFRENLTKVQSFKMERNAADGQVELTYDFICPNCTHRHTHGEIYSQIPARFSTVGYQLQCGWVTLVMPWAEGRINAN